MLYILYLPGAEPNNFIVGIQLRWTIKILLDKIIDEHMLVIKHCDDTKKQYQNI